MRLDIFLKRTHLVKHRTKAGELIRSGAVTLNNQQAKAGKNCQVGNRIHLKLPNRELLIEILDLPTRNFSAKEGSAFYTILKERKINSLLDWD